jgi:hypothetical protein
VSNIGHNKPPAYDKDKYAEFELKIDKLKEAAQKWINGGEIKDDEQSSKLADFINGAKQLKNKIEQTRKSEKQPYLDAGKQVDAAFKVIIDKSDISINAVTALQTAYLAAERKKQQEEERKARELAEAAQREAEEKARLAERTNSLDAVDTAQEAFEEAESAKQKVQEIAKQKVQAQSFTGAGRVQSLRVRLVAGEITDDVALFKRYRGNQKLNDLFRELVNAELRSKDKPDEIKGIKIMEEVKAV